ncbi:epidermal growth factor receptor kinase substrate 8-like protein 3 isoform X2 [Ambystoma mexicanum]
MSRPSGKSIYQQRKQYSQAIVSLHDKFHHRVEHLLTCELDGKQMRTVDDAMARLKMLDSQGRVWGQDVILQVMDGELSITDIETREELDCFSLESVLGCHSVLNSCSYNSVLALTLKELQARRTSIYLFQCEEIGADLLQVNIEKSIERGTHREEDPTQRNLRNDLENMLSQQVSSPMRGRAPSSQRNPWLHKDEPQYNPRPAPPGPQEESPRISPVYEPAPQRQSWQEEGPPDARPGRPPQAMDVERDSEVLNHVLGDVELFLSELKEATGYSSIKSTKKTKKKKTKNGKLPPDYRYNDTFQKIKYAFNLLGKIGAGIQEPSAPDLAHILFSALSFIMSNSPKTAVASSVVSPLLTQKAISLLNLCVSEQERALWQSLGDAWMLTRPDWPNGKDIPPYTPTFSDGWMPMNFPDSESREPMSNTPVGRRSQHPSPRESAQNPLHMRAMYDFIGRNSKELTVMKGEVLEVLDQSKQWWMAKNSSNMRGYIPNNVLEPMDGSTANASHQGPEFQDPVVVNQNSSPKEVATWLQTQGFSKLTVKCLGVLTGEQLLGLSREELKTVCPEDGGRVFHLLSSGRSSARPGH